jgi:hypothetical protein
MSVMVNIIINKEDTKICYSIYTKQTATITIIHINTSCHPLNIKWRSSATHIRQQTYPVTHNNKNKGMNIINKYYKKIVTKKICKNNKKGNEKANNRYKR